MKLQKDWILVDMRGFMWDNMNIGPLKLEEITVDKIIEIENHAQEVRLEQLTLTQLQEVAEKRAKTERELLEIEWDCKLRAMKAHTLGFSKAKLGKIFDVSQSTINRWVG